MVFLTVWSIGSADEETTTRSLPSREGSSSAVLLAAFFFAASIRSKELHPEQLSWLVLLPLIVVPLTRGGAHSVGRQVRGLPASIPGAFGLALITAVGIVAAHRVGWTFDEHMESTAWRSLTEYVPFLFAVCAIVWLYDRLLGRAEAENRALRGLLPICSWCHEIRDNGGSWLAVDRYMKDHGAQITHSICPTCMDRHYPEEPEVKPLVRTSL